MTDFIQAITTTASKEEAESIARWLVEQRLAACVQISGPMTSVYRWEGRVETSAEWQCAIKTRRSLWEALVTAIGRLHSYQVPEILALPVIAGSEKYLAWLEAQTDPQPHCSTEPRG